MILERLGDKIVRHDFVFEKINFFHLVFVNYNKNMRILSMNLFGKK